MSKSPNILLPAIGITGLVIGLAYGVTMRGYKAEEAALARTQAEAAEARAAAKTSENTALAAQIAEVTARAETAEAMAASGGGLTAPAPVAAAAYGLGRVALPEEIAAWDVDVLPDGRGLPEGRGDVFTGEEVFAEACAACHGDFAEGVDNWPVLAGGFDTLADKDPVKTVGSYWPYLSTVWDYVHRSMPFGAAQTLSDDEVYAIVAYILYSNDLVDEDFELSHENFANFEMYNTEGFIVDDRAETEYAVWRAEPCMSACKDSVEITMHASVLDVTPEENSEEASVEAAPAAESQQASADVTAPDTAVDPELAAAGEAVFRKCKACHMVGDGAKNRSGPQLNGIVGRAFAAAEGFKYSNAMQDGAEAGRVWDNEALAGFLADPKTYLSGTKMSFAGLKDPADVAAVIAYLRSSGG